MGLLTRYALGLLTCCKETEFEGVATARGLLGSIDQAHDRLHPKTL